MTFEYFQGGMPSLDAGVGSGPGCLTWICDPSLEGSAQNGANLVMTFASALQFFQFGAAASTALPTAMFVELFDGGLNSIGVFNLALQPLISFAEGLFTYDGAVAISRASLTFSPNDYQRFVVDNIVGREAIGVVPEPISMLLLGTGLVGVAAARRRRGRGFARVE